MCSFPAIVLFFSEVDDDNIVDDIIAVQCHLHPWWYFYISMSGQVKRHIDAELEFETYFGKVSFEAGGFGGWVDPAKHDKERTTVRCWSHRKQAGLGLYSWSRWRGRWKVSLPSFADNDRTATWRELIKKKRNFRNPVTLSEADVSISWQLVGDGQLQQEFTPIQVFKFILMMVSVPLVDSSKRQYIICVSYICIETFSSSSDIWPGRGSAEEQHRVHTRGGDSNLLWGKEEGGGGGKGGGRRREAAWRKQNCNQCCLLVSSESQQSKSLMVFLIWRWSTKGGWLAAATQSLARSTIVPG